MIQFKDLPTFNKAIQLIEDNKPEATVKFIKGKTEKVQPNLEKPYTFYDSELLQIHEDEHVLKLLSAAEIEFTDALVVEKKAKPKTQALYFRTMRRDTKDEILITVFLIFVSVLGFYQANAQETSEPCGKPFGVVSEEPTCNGKNWKQALQEKTDVSKINSDQRLRLMFTGSFDCTGELLELTPSLRYYYTDLSDVTEEQKQLLKELNKAAQELTCSAPKVKDKEVAFDLQVKQAVLQNGQLVLR